MITIFGQSAGSWSLSAHILSPLSRGPSSYNGETIRKNDDSHKDPVSGVTVRTLDNSSEAVTSGGGKEGVPAAVQNLPIHFNGKRCSHALYKEAAKVTPGAHRVRQKTVH